VLEGTFLDDGNSAELDISNFGRSLFTLVIYGGTWETATVALQSALNAGANFVAVSDESGTAISATGADLAITFRAIGDKLRLVCSGVTVACDVDYAIFH
jgi:hypothetical protein